MRIKPITQSTGKRLRSSTENKTVLPGESRKEAVHIRKEGHRAMNRDEGSYQLSQVALVCPHARAYWRHLANTIEPSVCGGDMALHQTAFTVGIEKAQRGRVN